MECMVHDERKVLILFAVEGGHNGHRLVKLVIGAEFDMWKHIVKDVSWRWINLIEGDVEAAAIAQAVRTSRRGWQAWISQRSMPQV